MHSPSLQEHSAKAKCESDASDPGGELIARNKCELNYN